MSASPTSLPAADELRAALVGRLLLPGEPEWARAATPWNVAVRAQPLAVVEAANPADVAAAVTHAAAHGIRVALIGPGHGASATIGGTLLIRTGGLRRLEISHATRTAIVGAGVSWGELQNALAGSGLTGLVGSSPSVSVVGLLLQGGYSWFSRAFGAAAGSLRGAEIVDARGEQRWVDDVTDAELVWALRGGGGRFAAITAVEVDLFPAESLAGGRLMFPIADAAAVVHAFAEVTRSTPREISLWVSTLHFPPLPELPDAVRGQSFVVVDGVGTTGLEALNARLAPIRGAGTVLRDTVATRGAHEIADICEEPVTPTPAVQRGIALSGLPDDAVAAFLAAATTPGPFMSLQLRHVGGSPVLRGGVGTAISAEYVVNALAIAPVPPAEAAAVQAMDALAETLAPWSGGPVLPSFVATWRTLADAYSPEQLERVAAVRTRVDPAGLFTASLEG
jgi:FAD/FMN-containing dehydrogenase